MLEELNKLIHKYSHSQIHLGNELRYSFITLSFIANMTTLFRATGCRSYHKYRNTGHLPGRGQSALKLKY